MLIKGNSFGGDYGVYLDGLIGTVVENNSFLVTNKQAVSVDTTTSSSTFRFNAILGGNPSTATFFNSTPNPVDARLNYWGSAAGPTSNCSNCQIKGFNGNALRADALVSTSPWIASYTSAGSNPDSRYTTGFWPTGVVQGN